MDALVTEVTTALDLWRKDFSVVIDEEDEGGEAGEENVTMRQLR